MAGSAADDLSHLVAELLDNAAGFSPAGSGVRLSAKLLESGAALVSVEDEGRGVPEPQLAELNNPAGRTAGRDRGRGAAGEQWLGPGNVRGRPVCRPGTGSGWSCAAGKRAAPWPR
ncbi:ATP-binding protein [Streptomyces sp. GKU 257-1]|nr:ATP-binding protein [Streptomyces sp. GKU 257-1]